MKHTKSIILTVVITAIFIGAMIFSACTKSSNACSGVSCLNGGTCTSGKCFCPSGYSGMDCGVLVNAAFIGEYGGVVNGGYGATLDNQSTSILVTNSATNPFKISILGSVYTLMSIGNIGMPNNDSMITFTGTISSTDTTTFTLKDTILVDALGDTCAVSGLGYIQGDSLHINFNNNYLSSSFTTAFAGKNL